MHPREFHQLLVRPDQSRLFDELLVQIDGADVVH